MALEIKPNALPFSVRIFLPTGNPEGLRIIEKSNWSGVGLAFPRSGLKAAYKDREELESSGVYVLIGPPTDKLPRAYIGESDELGKRLLNHDAKKDFWNQVVAFTSKDQNLNKAHVRHVEARLVRLAVEAGRCDLENSANPSEPSLSDADKADAELFLADMLLCLPVLGVDFFEKPLEETEISLRILETKGVRATGYEDMKGFIVKKGSQAVAEETPSIPDHIHKKRVSLQGEGSLKVAGNVFQFTRDVHFPSLSQAAGVVAGGSSDGPKMWKKGEG